MINKVLHSITYYLEPDYFTPQGIYAWTMSTETEKSAEMCKGMMGLQVTEGINQL